MNVFSKIFLVVVLSFSLSGCDWWDDMVDSISGSDDDKPAPVAEPAVAETAVVETATTTPPVAETPEVVVEQQTSVYETKFHHTQTGGPDGGKSLVMCSGQMMNFSTCSSDGIDIRFHGYDDGRELYWNLNKEPRGDIICVKNGKTYRYPASNPDSRGFVWGNC